jgi:hypothetical protein
MPSLVSRSKALLMRLWRSDAPLTATGLSMLAVLVVFLVGLAVDARTVLGAPVWLKPVKFAASIGVYSFTLAWVFGHLPAHARTRRAVSWISVAAMSLEMGVIGTQAARGIASHFNVTTPLNTALWALMGVAIIAQTASTIAVAVALFREKSAEDALGWALRLGMSITIAGAFLGGLMTQPDASQLTEMRAGRAVASGSHTVGAPDGGRGLPVTGWSREHGDLRVAHFLGLHAVQVLPLLALLLRRSRASRARQVRLVAVGAGSYAGLVALVLWQALRGQSLLAPDAVTVAALLGWVGLSVAGAVCALGPLTHSGHQHELT